MSKTTLIPIGPYHPLQEEAEFFQLSVEGEKVVDMDVRLSYNHRGIEKLSESMTFDQVPFLVERICGICSASHPLAYIQAVEDIAQVKVPERALYLRTLVNELERIHSHVLWVGLAGHFLGYNTVWMWAWKYREPILDLLEQTTGSRINYANAMIGGCRRDIANESRPLINKAMDDLARHMEMLTKAILDDPVLHARTKGVGVLNTGGRDPLLRDRPHRPRIGRAHRRAQGRPVCGLRPGGVEADHPGSRGRLRESRGPTAGDIRVDQDREAVRAGHPGWPHRRGGERDPSR